jgi:hypothetical protein
MSSNAPQNLAPEPPRKPTTSLGARIPPRDLYTLDDDAMLTTFVDWAGSAGYELYPAQEEAVLEIMAGNHVILNTPTGSGKSLVAMAMHFRGLAEGTRSVYTSPIKALVNEKFFDLCRHFGAENVGMLTGDAAVNRDAPILCCTAEILANIALREGDEAGFGYVIMDEFHYYADRDRGVAWQIPLLLLEESTYLLMSATLGDMAPIEEHIKARTGRGVSLVRSGKRPVPLEFEYRETLVHESIEELVGRGKAPVYVVNFTQRAAAEQAQSLMSVNFTPKEDKDAIAAELKGVRFESPYGKVMLRYLLHGIGLHHGGLLPRYRRQVERLAQRGLLRIMSGTDTLGVGVNIPIRTVLFTQLCKFDGEKVNILSVRDFQQIAGRAGRKGFDERGWVVCQAPEHVVLNKRDAEKPGKKKKVKASPPKKGFKPWDETTFQRLVEGEPEPLEPRFAISHGTMINLLQSERAQTRPGGGYGALVDLIERSHTHGGAKTHLRRQAARLFRALFGAEIVVFARTRHGRIPRLAAGLQHDFSLNQTLSLYLVETLDALDPEHADFALDAISLIESILESPQVVLFRQVDREKGRLIAELKADGVPYEERLERLEQVTYPKPNADFIYQTFERFRAAHPWIEADHVRPKSILREMVSEYVDFNNYVKDLGLETAEGVLLRYLSQAYKVLVQTVPRTLWTDALVDAIGYLRSMLGRVDSSLISEWEGLRVPGEDAGDTKPAIVDISADRRLFHARIRAEVHTLLRALAASDWEAAAALVRDDGDELWDAARLEDAMTSYFEAHRTLRVDHAARFTEHTRIEATAPYLWTVTQTLVDEDDDNDWFLEAVVDLREDKNPDGPLLALARVSGG